VIPDSTFRWSHHTNDDVPVFGTGALAAVVDGNRLDNLWIHSILASAIDASASVATPTVPAVVNGSTDDLGALVSTQVHATSFGAGYNQLDALYLSSDSLGLRVGVDGVFERGENTVLVLVDFDYGAETGLGRTISVSDVAGTLDAAISAANFTVDVAGVGFDVVVGVQGAEEFADGDRYDYAGLRGLYGAWGAADDYGWLNAASNFDDGNVADGTMAPDAGATGLTENGFETIIWWDDVFPAGLPATGTSVAVAVVLLNSTGEYASNQALPPFLDAAEPAEAAWSVASVAVLPVDATGVMTASAAVVP
jgi:hypothetical protein